MARAAVERLTGLVEPVVENQGYELVDLEYRKEGGEWVLRLFIDRTDGESVSHRDCEVVSEAVGRELDLQDPIPQHYLLEVSSPGLERPLKKEKDFQRFRGREVAVRTFAPLEGRRNFRGLLEGLENGEVIVVEGETRWRIPREAISRAHLEVSWDREGLKR